MANPTSFISVMKTIISIIFLFVLGLALIFGIMHITGLNVKEKILLPADKKLATRFCTNKPAVRSWTTCDDFSQTRINYYCNFSSKYNWQSFNEIQKCIPENKKEEYLLIKYNWTFQRKKYKWEYIFPKSLYDYYKNKERIFSNDYTIYATDKKDDRLISDLVNHFDDYADDQGFDKYEKVNFIISFVQGLPYTSDNITTGHDEYPRYPVETLVDNGGDCEDTSILTAVLLNEMGYNAVLLEFKNHMSVGVSCEPDIGTHYIDSYSNTFCYLETSGENWEIGMVPEEYKDKIPEIRYIVSKPSLKLEWTSTGKATLFSSTYVIRITLKNEGSDTAKNVKIWAGFDTTEKGKVYAQTQAGPFEIEPNKELYKELTLSLKRGKYTQLHIIVNGLNFETQESVSEWLTT